MTTTLIRNIGEFFTGDLKSPVADISTVLIENDRIKVLNPPAETGRDKTIDAAGLAVLSGLVDGHIHPVLGEWTPTQGTIG